MSNKTRIAINGFGRIGRRLFRLLHNHPSLEIVAINDLADAKTLAHLLKYDSIHGVWPFTISSTQNAIVINDKSYRVTQFSNPSKLKWEHIDFVIESTGKFKTLKALNKHLDAGAARVILTVPPADDLIKTVVMGVNEQILDGTEKIISNASCTTNNAAPMLKVIEDLCGINQAYITTIHSYTSDQSLHDQPHKDLRRARAAALSIVPTTTGAAKALTKIFPHLSNVIGGCGIRVPVPNGSLTDLTLVVKKPVNSTQINQAFKESSDTNLKGIVSYTEDPIVSIDIVNSTYSCVFDAQMTSVIGHLVKIIGWYDNETGYCSRIIDLINHITKK